MNKQTVLKIFKEKAGNHEFELTLKESNELLSIFEETIVALGEQLEVGESVNCGCIKIAKKRIAPRTGVSKLGEEEVPWSTPEKIKIVLSAKKSFEKEHEEIIE